MSSPGVTIEGVEVPGCPEMLGTGSGVVPLISLVSTPKEMPAAPPTAWVEARTSEPGWPPLTTLNPPSLFCCVARNFRAFLISSAYFPASSDRP